MSKISLTPNASGTGTFTIASPNSNTNRTLTLPDADGALLAGAQAAFVPATVSGATQALDVGAANFFDAGTLTADTTVSFTNVPTEARWTYTAEVGFTEAYSLADDTRGAQLPNSAQDSSMQSVVISPDGSKLYMSGGQNNNVYMYTLSVPYNLTTASYTSSFSVDSQEGSPMGLYFKPDGTSFFISGDQCMISGAIDTDNVYRYDMTTAWDITTASYVSRYQVTQDIYPQGVHFKSDGTKMYVVGEQNDSVYEYNLSTGWDITTTAYSKSFSVSAKETVPTDIRFSSDGTIMVVCGVASDSLHKYTLSTAWDISTASYAETLYVNYNPMGFDFDADGTRLYIYSAALLRVNQFNSALLTTLTLPSSVQNTPLEKLLLSSTVNYTFFTTDGGTTVKLINEEVL